VTSILIHTVVFSIDNDFDLVSQCILSEEQGDVLFMSRRLRKIDDSFDVAVGTVGELLLREMELRDEVKIDALLNSSCHVHLFSWCTYSMPNSKVQIRRNILVHDFLARPIFRRLASRQSPPPNSSAVSLFCPRPSAAVVRSQVRTRLLPALASSVRRVLSDITLAASARISCSG